MSTETIITDGNAYGSITEDGHGLYYGVVYDSAACKVEYSGLHSSFEVMRNSVEAAVRLVAAKHLTRKQSSAACNAAQHTEAE